MINELTAPLHMSNRKKERKDLGNEKMQSQKQSHIAGDEDKHNTPLCITYSRLFLMLP